MSSSARIIALLVIIAAVIFGVWKYNENQKIEQSSLENQNTVPTDLSSGTSDADLENDLNTIDANLAASDSAALDVDQGLNDKPIAQ